MIHSLEITFYFFEFIYFLLEIGLWGYLKKIDINCSSNSLCLVVSSWSSFLVFALYFEKKNSSYNSINALLSSHFYLTLSIEIFFLYIWNKEMTEYLYWQKIIAFVNVLHIPICYNLDKFRYFKIVFLITIKIKWKNDFGIYKLFLRSEEKNYDYLWAYTEFSCVLSFSLLFN